LINTPLLQLGYRALEVLKEEGKFLFFFNFYTEHLKWLERANAGCAIDLNFRLDAQSLAVLGKPEVTKRLVFFYGRATVLIEHFATKEEQNLLLIDLNKKIDDLKTIEDLFKEF
jgi:hypothetical protein